MLKKVGQVINLVKGQGTDGNSVYELQSQRDEKLKESLARMRANQEDFEEMNEFLRASLDIKSESGRSFFTRLLAIITPDFLRKRMSPVLRQFIAEAADPLAAIANMNRTVINNQQAALKTISEVGAEYYDQVEELRSKVGEAESEKWDAKKLQDYIAENADIQLDPAIQKLLEREYGLLTDEDKETIRQSLIRLLKDNVLTGEKLITTLRKSVSIGLTELQLAMAQFYSYMRFYGPASVLRDGAEAMTDTSNAMFISRDALIFTIRKSIEALCQTAELAGQIPKYAIAGPEMIRELEAGTNQLETSIKELNDSRKRYALEGPKQDLLEAGKETDAARQITDGGTVEPEIVEASQPAVSGILYHQR